jgi:hypothetical protein
MRRVMGTGHGHRLTIYPLQGRLGAPHKPAFRLLPIKLVLSATRCQDDLVLVQYSRLGRRVLFKLLEDGFQDGLVSNDLS